MYDKIMFEDLAPSSLFLDADGDLCIKTLGTNEGSTFVIQHRIGSPANYFCETCSHCETEYIGTPSLKSVTTSKLEIIQ